MTTCFFVSDLHGQTQRYEQLFRAIIRDRPQAVFLGGDLFPTGWAALTGDDSSSQDFVNEYLAARFMKLREQLAEAYPRVFLILGNDDGRWPEVGIRDGASRGLWASITGKQNSAIAGSMVMPISHPLHFC